MGVHRTLQNGGNPSPEGHPTIRRQVCEKRSKRCLLHNPTCLHFGLSCAPCTFTKVLKPVMTLLHSWEVRIIVYIDDMLGHSRASVTTPPDPLVDTTCLGVYCQSRQICAQTNPRDKVPGPGCRLGVYGNQPPMKKTEANQERGYKTPLPITRVSQSSVSVQREAKHSRSSSGSSSPVLPPPAGQLEKPLCPWQP